MALTLPSRFASALAKLGSWAIRPLSNWSTRLASMLFTRPSSFTSPHGLWRVGVRVGVGLGGRVGVRVGVAVQMAPWTPHVVGVAVGASE